MTTCSRSLRARNFSAIALRQRMGVVPGLVPRVPGRAGDRPGGVGDRRLARAARRLLDRQRRGLPLRVPHPRGAGTAGFGAMRRAETSDSAARGPTYGLIHLSVVAPRHPHPGGEGFFVGVADMARLRTACSISSSDTDRSGLQSPKAASIFFSWRTIRTLPSSTMKPTRSPGCRWRRLRTSAGIVTWPLLVRDADFIIRFLDVVILVIYCIFCSGHDARDNFCLPWS